MNSSDWKYVKTDPPHDFGPKIYATVYEDGGGLKAIDATWGELPETLFDDPVVLWMPLAEAPGAL